MAVAGILIGLAGFFLKSSLLDITNVAGFLLHPVSWVAGILGLAGFMVMQKALHGGHVSVVTPVMAGISIALPVVLAYLFLGEAVSMLKWAGVILIVVGVLGLGK